MIVETARAVVERALRDRVFPAAVAEVGDSHGVQWRQPFGRLTFDDHAAPATEHILFDLASLTKPIATTSIVMELVAKGRLDVREPVASFFSEWRGADRETATVQDLLEHSSGLAARLVDAPPSLKREFEHDICTMRLEYPVRSQSIYSDLGFILLGLIVENRGRSALDKQFAEIAQRTQSHAPIVAGDNVSRAVLGYGARPVPLADIAPTLPEPGDPRRGRMLSGAVHDDYAAALGGVAGHAGLFGNADGVGAFARTVLRGARGDESVPVPFSPSLIARAITRSAVEGSSRALGWDTMLPTSSCGSEMSPAAFGHVGFTGTSLWIDPLLDRYFVLLTNRACGGGTLAHMREVRRAFHNAIARS